MHKEEELLVVRVSKDNFTLETQDRIAYQLIIIKGNFTVKNLLEVRNVITELLDTPVKNMVFDLENCGDMDSSSIGLLGNLYKKIRSREGVLGILRPPSKVQTLLAETGLSKILPAFNSLEDVDTEFEA